MDKNKKAIKKLHKFINGDGLRDYTITRNFDFEDHDNVSQLSPLIRNRVITEADVIKASLSKYPYSQIEKFIQEVFWRTYWKGWLEQRAEVWEWYKQDRDELFENLPDAYAAAINGETDIACFNYWVRELVETGYLHNHARMWFASIWIFTLKLPWQLGADFFMANLLDGDAASNTLSWRWVAGLQTKGKTYLARASNIKKFTDGRFNTEGQLNEKAEPLEEDYNIPDPSFRRRPDYFGNNSRIGLLITEDDVSAEDFIEGDFVAKAAINLSRLKSKHPVADHVRAHVDECMDGYMMIDDIDKWRVDHNLDHIVTAHTPIGHVADYLKDFDIRYIARDYDQACWPYVTKGFFKFREKIPKLIDELNVG